MSVTRLLGRGVTGSWAAWRKASRWGRDQYVSVASACESRLRTLRTARVEHPYCERQVSGFESTRQQGMRAYPVCEDGGGCIALVLVDLDGRGGGEAHAESACVWRTSEMHADFLADEIDKHGRVCLSVAAGEGMSVRTKIEVHRIMQEDVYAEAKKCGGAYGGATRFESEAQYDLTDVRSIVTVLLQTRSLQDAREINYIVKGNPQPVWRAPLDVGWLESTLSKVKLQKGGVFEIRI